MPEDTDIGNAAFMPPPQRPAPDADPGQGPAQELSARVQERAESMFDRSQDRVREQVQQRSTQLGDQLQQQASDLRAVSDSLHEQGKTAPAQTAQRLAGYAEQAGNYLRRSDADAILNDVERFGRERPGAFAAGSLALGFAASRLLKASSSRRYHARSPQRTAGPAGTSRSPVTSAAAGHPAPPRAVVDPTAGAPRAAPADAPPRSGLSGSRP